MASVKFTRISSSAGDLKRLFWLACAFLATSVATYAALDETHSMPAMAELMGEDVIAGNIIWVCDHAASLPDDERFAYLANWVFPSATHSTLRLQSGFRQLDPAPIAVDSGNEIFQRNRNGNSLASPVFDLLDLAAKLNRMPELTERLAKSQTPASNEQQRSRVALELLIAMEINVESPEFEKGVTALAALITQPQSKLLREVWPETLVVARGIHRCPRREAIGDLLTLITSHRTELGVPREFPEWHALIISLARQYSYGMTHIDQDINQLASDFSLRQWRSNPRQRGYSRGSGFPQSIWSWDGSQIEHVSGHEEDYLIFQSPLLGDFAIDFDTPSEGQAQIFAGGNSFGPLWRDHTIYGDLRHGAKTEPLLPQLNQLDAWTHCRVEFQGDVRSLFINGRCVRTDKIAGNRDPWIATHCWRRDRGGMRDVRITGRPTIPESILLAVNADLIGWHSYHEDSVGFPEAAWRFEADAAADNGNTASAAKPGQIIGRHFSWIPDTNCERMLRYHRPLFEDGTVEYEFFYEPGRVMTFPALDRLAFIINPGGVRIHWVTDERFDPSEVAPENIMTEPQNRRGPETLTLKVSDWNRMRIAITGETVSLTLNDQLIYQRALEPTNTRHFGLFYFADQTEARVRNITMTADWPKSLPSLTEQELANRIVTVLDTEVAKLGPQFQHDFAAGLPEKYFIIQPSDRGGQVDVTNAGLECMQTSNGPSTNSVVRPLFEVHGDFDISVSFDEWRSSNHDYCGSSLVLRAATGHRFAVTRRVQAKTSHWAVLEWAIPKGNGEFSPYYQTLMTEATGGKLRAVRQGDVWHALYADDDSSVYRLIGTAAMKDTATQPVTLEMHAVSGESGTTQFTWKDIRIATNELMMLPDARDVQKVSVFIMNVDGSDLHRVSVPTADDPGHGSPDWSPDGKQILHDSWRGSANASRIFIVNADGTNPRELGTGSMPTFSMDGKRIAFSGGQGMSIMNTDGSNREVIAQGGWGAQWSPSGRWISYGDYQQVNGEIGANIVIADVKTKAIHYVLEGEHAKRYTQIVWNMEWSPDSRQICFKGSLKSGGSELAITDVEGSSHGFQVLTNQPIEPDQSWHPDGSKILVAMRSPKHANAVRLFVYNLTTKAFVYLDSQPDFQNNNSGVWSPDGKQIAFIGLPKVEPIRWEPE